MIWKFAEVSTVDFGPLGRFLAKTPYMRKWWFRRHKMATSCRPLRKFRTFLWCPAAKLSGINLTADYVYRYLILYATLCQRIPRHIFKMLPMKLAFLITSYVLHNGKNHRFLWLQNIRFQKLSFVYTICHCDCLHFELFVYIINCLFTFLTVCLHF